MEKAQQVWVAYAAPEQQFLVAIPFEAGMTALKQLRRVACRHRSVCLSHYNLASLVQKLKAHAILQAGDRVEVYRPLTINPKDIRRKRAEKNSVGRYIKSNRFKQ
ncbi:RnfH family protein [Acinetobacter pittii]